MSWTRKHHECGILVAGSIACTLLAACTTQRPYTDEFDPPKATYYTVVVRPGDSLSELAARYDCPAGEVANLNRLDDTSLLRTGQILRIPVDSRATREAILAEAGSSERNYAPPPKPIDTAHFASRDTVSVRNLPPPDEKGIGGDVADSRDRRNVQFVWPVAGRVISPFGKVGNGERNDGINIAAAAGTPIRAAAAGTVTYAGNELKGYGNLVLIQHADGYVTAYAHADSITVSRGDRVERGDMIGRAGATGDVDRPQLHFEIRKGSRAVNPRQLLASKD